MPDLGKYAGVVTAAYAVSLVMIAVLVGLTLWRSARTRRALHDAEARRGSRPAAAAAAAASSVGPEKRSAGPRQGGATRP